MYPEPYKGIYPAVQEALEDLILPGDKYHMTHLRRIARTIEVFLNQSPQGKVLELGTGGVIPLALKKILPDLEIYVTNFDESMDKCHTYVAEMKGNRAEFPSFMVDLEYDQIPVEDEFFDWVLCCEVVEHMEIDPMAMMCEINRVTKTGGGLIVTTPNITSSHALTKIVYGYEPHFYMQYLASREYHRHNYEYSIHSLSSLINASGYSGKMWTEDTFEAGMVEVPTKLRNAGFALDHLGDNIFTVAKKASGIKDRHPHPIYDMKQDWHG